jgi:integrase
MSTDCTGRVVERTDETRAAYERRVEALQRIADGEQGGGDLVDWFCRQDKRWSASTVRQYRAAILMHMEQTLLHPVLTNLLKARLAAGPLPKSKGPRRTSARKRKSLSVAEFLRLEQLLDASGKPDDALIRGFVVFGAALFLRPVEYLNARVEGARLFVLNAKASNGRANGVERERDLTPMGPKAIATLIVFLDRLGAAAASAASWKKLHNRLAARLARVCAVLGIKRVSLYTLRHVGMATAKRWVDAYEIAAAAGHGSERTATAHYAKRRSGWIGLRLAGKPSAQSIGLVRGTPKLFQGRTRTPQQDQAGPDESLRAAPFW